MTKIKICGITSEEEVSWLNDAGVSYAGFVIYEKSKRYISVENAQRIAEKLNANIKKVAVTVSPESALVRQIERAGFDILQIHGDLEQDVIGDTSLSLWRAVNLSGLEELRQWQCPLEEGIDGILFDAGDFGSGKTFGWEAEKGSRSNHEALWKNEFSRFRAALAEQKRQFILAGGLHPGNVADGIALFSPDVVDVSSGVEEIVDGKRGKSRAKIEAFVQAVQNAKRTSQDFAP